MRKAAILFAIFLLTVVVLADLGYLRFLLNLISIVPFLDKVLHFLLVGTLTYLVVSSLIESFPNQNPVWLTIFGILLIAFIFTLEEISQGPIRGRDASWLDLAANYAGVSVFGYLAWRRNHTRTLPNLSD